MAPLYTASLDGRVRRVSETRIRDETVRLVARGVQSQMVWRMSNVESQRGGPDERLLVVAEQGRRVPGLQAPLLLPVLRLLGRVGQRRPRGRPSPLHLETARHAPDVGGAYRPRRDRDGAQRVSRG